MKIKPVPGCPKIYGWAERLEAREELLRQWQRGDFRRNGTHWCGRHGVYHLTSHATKNGNNYRYRD